jgi:adenylate cyclase
MNPDLVELLVREPSRVRLGGERRVLSVFFSDLANFTNLSERLEPEQLVSLLNIYLTEMTEIILRYEGYLDKYEGDAIMAAFGTPIPQTDHACRVCWAALECVERLATLVKELKDESYFDQRGIPPLSLPAHLDWDLSMRIGVNSGPVVAGNMGSLSRMDYTVMGDVVNLASRLEGANKGYGTRIMAGEETIRLAGDGVETRVLDLLRVKGKEKPVWVYEVMARQGGLSPQQLQLRALYEKAHAAYLARRWEEASEGFCEAMGVDPTDGPSRTYLERCTIYAKEPPPMDWEGVFVLRTK